MRRSRIRRRVVGGTLCCVAVVVSSVRPVAADAPGTIVIAPNDSAQIASLHRVSVSSAGVAYTIPTVDRDAFVFRAVEYGGEEITLEGTPPPCSAVSVDHVLTVGDALAVPIASDDVNCPITSVEIRGFDDVLRSTVDLSADEAFIGFTGDAVVVLAGPSGVDDSYDVLLRAPEAADEPLVSLPDGELGGALFDAGGGFFQWLAGGIRTLYRVTLPDGAVEPVEGGPPLSPAPAFLTATTVGWMNSPADVGYVSWQPRAGGAATELSLGSAREHFNAVAMSGATLGWVATHSEGDHRLHLRPADGSGTDEALGLLLTDPRVWADPNGGFVVVGYHPVDGFGILHVSEDGQTASLIQALAPFWARVERIDLTAGRLVLGDDAASPGAVWSTRVRRDGGLLVPGPMRMLGGDAQLDHTFDAVLASGPRTAYIREAGSEREIVVLRGSSVERSLAVDDDAYLGGLSGNHLLIGHVGAPSTVINVVTGSSDTVPATAVLWGRWVIYTEGLSGGGTRLVKRDVDADPVEPPTPITEGESGFQQVISWWGPWVLNQRGADAELLDVRSGESFPVPWDTSAGVGDGFIAALDYDGVSSDVVVVMDLTDDAHPVTTLGSVAAVVPVEPWGFDSSGGQLVAWRARDRLVHVGAVPVNASRPRQLDARTPRRFSPNGDGFRDIWTASFDYSKPVRWTLKIMDPFGVRERLIEGTAPLGWIQVRWRGFGDSGRLLPGGFHRWKLHVAGIDGIGAADASGSVFLAR